ncbi:2091_t:CDS:2 [Entrophospora sp. SA101]|nr:2091_t:CDS:2 [Entrophospora sp. SA101]CAJ0829829.1 6614_t:CDS:2 [Entrophospora sp. SA101]CAJ0829838.1 6617_t:CDS:2 [Entrophospora sp. SA101]CAJ0841393.1 1067_t:CDS:2 [Entrophospora sp. SA101]
MNKPSTKASSLVATEYELNSIQEDNLCNNGNNYANGNVKGMNVNNNNIIGYDYDFDDIPTTSIEK